MARLEIARTAIVPTANILVSLETIWNEEIVKVWAAAWLPATRAWRLHVGSCPLGFGVFTIT